MKKRLLIVLLIMLTLSFDIIKANADGAISDVSSGDAPPSDQTTPDTGTGGGNGNKCDIKAAGIKTDCGINATHNYRSAVYIDIYNTEGKYIGNGLEISEIDFEAGRFVGVDAFESYINRRTVTINPSCFQVTVTCEKKSPGKIDNSLCNDCVTSTRISKHTGKLYCLGNLKPGCLRHEKTDRRTITSGTCESLGDGWNWVSSSCSSCAPPSVESCHGEAIANLNNMTSSVKAPSYNAERQNSNDITKKETYPIEPYITNHSTGVIKLNNRTFYREIEYRIKYNPQRTCLNVKTGEVRYIKFNENCNKDSEITVKNYLNSLDEPIGMYFIPLNAKTGTNFSYFLKSGDKQKTELCKAFIEKYESDGRWRILLLDQDKNAFSPTTPTSEGISRVKNGCYYAYTLNFKISQNFYNEQNSKIRGYGSFYRPIDINNPFPNGLSENSYWNGLIDTTNNVIKIIDSNNTTKKYNLSDSFKEKTYSIYNINANAIREYNHQERNFYTSWEDMKINGTSNFIDQYVTRHSNKDYYKLGCGPANSDWEECKQ